jgi:hypothetical protein
MLGMARKMRPANAAMIGHTVYGPHPAPAVNLEYAFAGGIDAQHHGRAVLRRIATVGFSAVIARERHRFRKNTVLRHQPVNHANRMTLLGIANATGERQVYGARRPVAERRLTQFRNVKITPEPAIEISGAPGVPLILAMARGHSWRGHVLEPNS